MMLLSPTPWSRLVAAARRASAAGEQPSAPVGFATRVVAIAFQRADDRPLLGLFERFSWRALGMAGGLAAASVLFNFSPAVQAFEHDFTAEHDPVALVLDLPRR